MSYTTLTAKEAAAELEETPLSVAIREGHLSVATVLAERGALIGEHHGVWLYLLEASTGN